VPSFATLFKFLHITIFLLIAATSTAQNPTDSVRRWAVALAPHYGFIVPHTKQMEHLITGHSFGGNVSLFRPVTGKSYWHHAYNKPEQGFDFSFINTGNMRQLGVQLSSSFLLNLPLTRKKRDFGVDGHARNFRHWLGLGIGLGYATRNWDLENNHQAAILGSQSNIALALQYSVRIIKFSSGEIRGGLRISHLSNGAYQLPNLGTNNAGLFISYVLNNEKKASILSEISKPEVEKFRYTFGVLGGMKEIPPPNGIKHGAFVFSALAEKRISYKSSFGLGLDVLYNSSLKILMERRSDESVSSSDVLQLGGIFSYTMHFNAFELKMQQGFYLRDNWKTDGSLYHRFGLRYRINSHLYTQLTLKTHFAKADYGEFGFGYSF